MAPKKPDGSPTPPPPPDDGFEIEVAVPFIAAHAAYEDEESGQTMTPDYIGEIIAWRVWRVMHPLDQTGKTRLQSLGAGGGVHSAVWTPGKRMEAFCARHSPAPAASCSCGFYSAKDKKHLLSMSYHRGDNFESLDEILVIGEVAMSGRIVPGTQGWRAQYVRPVSVRVPYARWKVVKPIQTAYPGVTVTLENFLRKQDVPKK